jgi:phosphopantothenoylcysteine decarboxylase / phosphopantothenate---cysteine ligase
MAKPKAKNATKVADRAVSAKSSRLSGKRVAFGVCGGIGSVEVVKIIRELRRHGAEVHPFLTPSVEKFVTALSIEWAAGRKPVREADAPVEYLEDFDALVVAPATLNTIVKAALGISDNVVALTIAGHLGAKKPVVIYPTMNEKLLAHPRYEPSLRTLREWGAVIPEIAEEEGRRKMPTPEQVAQTVLECLK